MTPALRHTNVSSRDRVDPVERTAGAVVAKRSAGGQGPVQMMAHRRAAQREAQAQVGRRGRPAALLKERLVELIGLLAGPVAGGKLQGGR